MAESISEPMQRSAVRTDGTRPVQGSVTAHGTLAVYEPGIAPGESSVVS